MDLKIDNELRDLVPSQTQDEHAGLEESLLKYGFNKAYPIITWDGTIVDGHNRYELCKQHDIEFFVSEQAFNNRSEVINWMIDNQLNRRNITADQRAYLIGKRYKEEKKAPTRPKIDIKEQTVSHLPSINSPDNNTSHKIAERLKVSHQTVKNDEKFAEAVDKVAENTGISPQKILSGEIKTTRKDIQAVSKLAPEVQKKVFEKIEKKEVKNVKDAVKEVKFEEMNEIMSERSGGVPENIELIEGDFTEVYKNIEAESVDFIITDPPYPKEFLPLYEDLAKCAKHVLKPGGSMFVMIGQSYIPEILNMMTKHVDYHWTLSYLTPGGQSAQLWQKKVNTFWKPVLWFTKGKYEGKWTGDVIKSDKNDNDKRFHKWGQSESGMFDLMRRFVSPIDKVLDPFMGGGTTGIICKELKCDFIGIEKEKDVFEIAKARLGDNDGGL